jgi:hypothetical protein
MTNYWPLLGNLLVAAGSSPRTHLSFDRWLIARRTSWPSLSTRITTWQFPPRTISYLMGSA